jgi:hypothetical protein
MSINDRHCALELAELCSSKTAAPDPVSAYVTRVPLRSMLDIAAPSPGDLEPAHDELDQLSFVPVANRPESARHAADDDRGGTANRVASMAPRVVESAHRLVSFIPDAIVLT